MDIIAEKVKKYLILTLGLAILKTIGLTLILDIFKTCKIDRPELLFEVFKKGYPYLLDLIFAIILYVDCKKDTKNIYTISLLGFISPILGACFYLIESYVQIKCKQNEQR